jgi:hypothetical protein
MGRQPERLYRESHVRRLLRIDDSEQHLTITDGFRLENLLDQTGVVNVYFDCPEDQGPASGTLYSFFRRESDSDDLLRTYIKALVEACRADFAMLKQREAVWHKEHHGQPKPDR